MAVPPSQVPPIVPPPMPPPMPIGAGKADLGNRFIAALIDGILMCLVAWIPFIGAIIAGAYILVKDGLEIEFADRRSIGKKIMKLRPIRLDGQPMDIVTSAKRNLPFVIGMIGMPFYIIPVLGWLVAILFGVIGLLVAIIEILLTVSDQEGRRWGDKLAGTKVIQVAE